MILADTSVWVEHFRKGLAPFAEALRRGAIATHPVVIGELAVGNLSRRLDTLTALQSLPVAPCATTQECLTFIERHDLYGRGIGWGDVQLLASARISGFPLWSLDRRLAEAAAEQGIAHPK